MYTFDTHKKRGAKDSIVITGRVNRTCVHIFTFNVCVVSSDQFDRKNSFKNKSTLSNNSYFLWEVNFEVHINGIMFKLVASEYYANKGVINYTAT